MIAVVQRVRAASVAVDGEVVGRIERGLCVLAAVTVGDDEAALQWVAKKLATLRVFPQGDQAYHLDVSQVGGAVLLVSNFTVAAETSRGRRPGFDRAMRPDAARLLFDRFVAFVGQSGVAVATGKFGADMIVTVQNDGPMTLVVRSPDGGGRE